MDSVKVKGLEIAYTRAGWAGSLPPEVVAQRLEQGLHLAALA